MSFTIGKVTSEKFDKLPEAKQRKYMKQLARIQGEALETEKKVERIKGKLEGVIEFIQMINKSNVKQCKMLERSMDIYRKELAELHKEQQKLFVEMGLKKKKEKKNE